MYKQDTCDVCGEPIDINNVYGAYIDKESIEVCHRCHDVLILVAPNDNIDTETKIVEATDSVAAMLIDKNRKYGNSALNQLGIFNKLTTSGSISSRVDDKLARIKNSECLRRDDLFDLIGYLILLQIENGWEGYNREEKV